MDPLLVIVNGPPGAGKTSLGRRLAEGLHLPFLSKDDIKEALFDTLGWSDRAWSMKLGRASMEILFHALECQLQAGGSAVAETAFIPEYHTPRFLSLRQAHPFYPVQVYCTSGVEVLYERFHRRIECGERHPGHCDRLASFDQLQDAIRSGKYGVLEIGGGLIEVDTVDFAAIEMDKLCAAVSELRANHSYTCG